MPNWCMNILSVSGEDSLVKKFRNAARGHTQAYNRFSSVSWPIHDDIRLKAAVSSLPDMGEVSDLSFHALYPVPEDFMRYPYDCNSAREFGERVGETRPYGGYGWETTHWGVKWGACRPEVVSEAEEREFLQYNFETPWGPPTDWLEKVAGDWPNLCFELSYEEPGMGFAGEVQYSNGECCHESTWDIEYDEEDEDGE